MPEQLTPGQKLASIGAELQKAEQTNAGVPQTVGMLSIKSVNQALSEASMQKNPIQLYGEFWFEGEICCLFADSNVGKSILAVQIAADIARTQKVLYFDFELSEKQFQLRCKGSDGSLHRFPSNLYRVDMDLSLSANLTEPFEDALIKNIEQVAVAAEAKVLIIDNISILCMQMEKGEDAAILVQRLRALKNKYGFSILIIAHTPKRNMSMPITQNDLAGSKKLFNFIDSSFAIGKSAQAGNMRYIKQIKVRNCETRYGSDNVMVCNIEKVEAMVQFVPQGTDLESRHLRIYNREEQMDEVRQLSDEGLSLRQIADKVGISKSQVDRLLKQSKSGVPETGGTPGTDGTTVQDQLSQVSQPSHVFGGTAGKSTSSEQGDDEPF